MVGGMARIIGLLWGFIGGAFGATDADDLDWACPMSIKFMQDQ